MLDVGGADEIVAQALLQRLDAPALPQEAVASPGAEVRDLQRPFVSQRSQPLDLAPQLGLGARVEHVEVETAHEAHRRAGPELVDDGKRGDFPHGRPHPLALEPELVLAVALRQLVGRQLEAAEPIHEARLENLLSSVERVTRQPNQFVLGEPEGPCVVELVDQLALLDNVGESHLGGAIDELEGHPLIAVLFPNHL